MTHISIERKLGWTWVRGGRVVPVVKDHACTTKSYDPAHYAAGVKRTFRGDWATARAGDLALEICAVATGNVIAHTYLTGEAQGLVNYGCVMSWFGPHVLVWSATLAFERLRDFHRQGDALPPQIDGQAAIDHRTPMGTYGDAMATVLRAVYAPPPVRIVRAEIRDLAPGEVGPAAEWIANTAAYRDADDQLVQTAHVIVHLAEAHRRGEVAVVHIVPPGVESDNGASGFQAALIGRSLDVPEIDLWDDAAYHAACRAVAPDARVMGHLL